MKHETIHSDTTQSIQSGKGWLARAWSVRRVFGTSLLTASLLLVTSYGYSGVSDSNASATANDLLKPKKVHTAVSALTRRHLGRYHYQPRAIDDELSRQMFNDYLESLDPSKAYFLASDIEYFRSNELKLDDFLRRDDARPAFDIFNVYRQRVGERMAHVQEALKGEFDFDIDETLTIDREDVDWAVNEHELNDYWRKRVKNDWLRLKLADKEPEDIRDTLVTRYEELQRRIAELDSNDIFQLYLNAYLSAVEPHTSYLSPRSSDNFEIAMSLSFEGIGALLSTEGEYTIIRSIVPGGPADKDNRLKPGDRIIGVGQGDEEIVDVIGWRVDDVVDLIRGPKDSVVVLDTLPEDVGLQGPNVPIDLVRNEIQLEEQAARAEVIEVPDFDDEGNESKVRIGMIDVPTFYFDFEAYVSNKPNYRSSTRDVRKLINRLKKEDISGLVIDLRNNGGGSLLEATTMSGLFIDQGPVVQVRDSQKRVDLQEDNEPGMAWDGPLVVLVNRYSASASEIFAAAMQDYGRALVVGEPTFGKGTVQNLFDLDNRNPDLDARRGQLKLTMAQFFRIDGGSTQNRGVIPDIRLPSAGEPQDFGESSLDNALPWTRIEPAEYQAQTQLQGLLGQVLGNAEIRMQNDPEFTYLHDDIAEYERNIERKTVSLLEATRRSEMDAAEARRTARRDAREQLTSTVVRTPLDPPAEPLEVAENDDEAADDDEQGVDEPDIYLEESSRVLADLILLQSENRLLASAPQAVVSNPAVTAVVTPENNSLAEEHPEG